MTRPATIFVRRARPCTARRGYTLIELLIVVALLGLAAALVIPQVGSTNVLRVESVVRSIVASITVAQSEALATQERRAIVFDTAGNHYTIYRVRGNTIEPEDMIERVQLFATGTTGLVGQIEAPSFNSSNVLVFDELGGPVRDLTSTQPADRGTVRVTGFGSAYEIEVEAYTGRVRVTRLGP